MLKKIKKFLNEKVYIDRLSLADSIAFGGLLGLGVSGLVLLAVGCWQPAIVVLLLTVAILGFAVYIA